MIVEWYHWNWWALVQVARVRYYLLGEKYSCRLSYALLVVQEVTLRDGVQNMLCHYVPEVVGVVQVSDCLKNPAQID